MKEIFQGNITKETADLIKQLQQSGGVSTEHTLRMMSLPDNWYDPTFYTTTAQQNIVEQFEWSQGKEFNERLYELFKNGVLNAYIPKDVSTTTRIVRAEFSINESGEITLSAEGEKIMTLTVPSNITESLFEGVYVDTSNDSVVAIAIRKEPGETP